jgi:integration host factor subunit alpha
MTVTKQDLIEHLYDTVGLSRTEARGVVEVFFDSIRETLARGEEVKLSGFGNFILRDKRARPGRNPRTRDPVEIKARRVVIFHSSLKLRAHCNPGTAPKEGAVASSSR